MRVSDDLFDVYYTYLIFETGIIYAYLSFDLTSLSHKKVLLAGPGKICLIVPIKAGLQFARIGRGNTANWLLELFESFARPREWIKKERKVKK